MPLPPPLKKGASKKKKRQRAQEVMHDLKHGPHHKDRTHNQEVAIMMKETGQSRRRKKRSKKAE